MSQIADRYAKALFDAARESGALDAVASEMEGLAKVFEDAEVREGLTAPDVSEAARGRVLAKLGEGRHQLIRNVVGVLQERHRVTVLPELPAAFETLVLQERGIVRGVVQSSHAFDDSVWAQVQEIADRLAGDRKVYLTFESRPELLGGIRLRIGNTMYDGSLKTQLEDLRQDMLAAPLA